MPRWPAPSIVVRSRRTRGATGVAMPPRGCRKPQCRGTDGIRAADTGSSANPNLQYRQHAQNPRQEGGPDHEVARQECIESEKYQGDPGAMVIHVKKEERQRLQLLSAEYI